MGTIPAASVDSSVQEEEGPRSDPQSRRLRGPTPEQVERMTFYSGPMISAGRVRGLISGDDDIVTLQRDIAELTVGPLYQKIGISGAVLAYLKSEATVRTTGYEYEVGKHDLNRVAGRAALVLETLSGLKLPPVAPDTAREELQVIWGNAAMAMKAWRAGAVQAAGSYRVDSDKSAFRARYHGKIGSAHISGEHAAEGSRLMEMLLLEWFPIGERMADLEGIVGVASRRSGDLNVYSFEYYPCVVLYCFRVDDGIIQSVEIRHH